MKILAIETSADDTAAAITEETTVLSNVRYSQLEHANWGGIVPSLAKREHEVRIGPVIEKALADAQMQMSQIDAIAVTVGPGLAIALEVGIRTAKELAEKYNKPLIATNHIEGHLLSPLASNPQLSFPALGLVVSGGHTELILIEKIGQYKIIAETIDDALGEALDKGARLLGFPYPGGALLEKTAALGNFKKYSLPRPMAGREDQHQFSYSGLKAAFSRLVAQIEPLDEQKIADLAAAFQNRAFEHLERVLRKTISHITPRPPLNLRGGGEQREPRVILVGGGVIANQELRKRLNKLGQELGLEVHFAKNEFAGDNAVMIGIAASFKAEKGLFSDPNKMDRLPRWRVDA